MTESKVILFDASRLLSRATANTPTGIDRVSLNYIQHFANNLDYQLVCLALKKGTVRCLARGEVEELIHKTATLWQPSSEWAREKLQLSNYQELTANKKLYISRSPVGRTIFTGQLHDLALLKNSKRFIYINVAHQGLEDTAFFWSLKHSLGAEIVTFIHDLIPITYPEYTREGETLRHEGRISTALNFSDLIIVNSIDTKSEVTEYAREKKLRLPAVEPLYIGVEPFNRAEKEAIPYPEVLQDQNYFVVLGTIEPRKNHLLLLNIWRDFVEQEVKDIPKLVIIGKRGWCNENIIAMLDRCEKIKPHILELSDITDQQLAQLLKNSKALLFPSFVEGWGMPLIEALSLNVKVICSDLKVFRESGKDLPVFLDPLDAGAWEQTILSTSRDLTPVSYNVPLPTWMDHFNKLDFSFNAINTEAAALVPLKPVHFNEGFKEKIKMSLLAFLIRVIPEKAVRKFLKFSRTPVKAMVDTKFTPVSRLGKFLAKG